MIIGLRSSKSCVDSVALAFPFQMNLGFCGLDAMVKFCIPMFRTVWFSQRVTQALVTTRIQTYTTRSSVRNESNDGLSLESGSWVLTRTSHWQPEGY